jgi:DamX protein
MSDGMTDEQSPQAADYLARFGLQREPFDAAPDPEFFCADSTLTQRLDMLQNLTEFGMLTLLVIGEPGVGKTSMLQQYLQHASSNWQVCHLEADALGNAHDLVADLAAGFQAPGADLAQLRAQLDGLRAQGQLAVLVVDDAERLPDAALRTVLELSGAAGETDKRLRLVLFGTEHLQDKLAALSPGHADNTHVFNLPPLSELQTAAYLQHRLRVAGLHEEAVFTAGQVKSIVKASKGVPAQINARARQLLIDRHSVSGGSRVGVGAAAAAIASPARRRALFAAAGVGVLLIAVALWPKSAKHDAEPSSVAVPVPEKTVALALPNVAPAASATNSTAAGTSAASAAQTSAAPVTPLPVPTLGPEVEHPVPTSPSGKIAVSSVPAPETAAPPIAPAGNVAHPVTPAMTTVTVPVGPAAATAAKEPVPPVAAPTPATHAEVMSAAAKPPVTAAPAKAKAVAPAETKTPPVAKSTPHPKPAVTATAVSTVKGVTSSRDNIWLKTQRPGDYTLQIMGGRREAAIRQFAAANRLEGPSAILHTVRDGKPWYVLLYGAYPSRAAASQALAQMPAAVRAAKPWPRSIATVQADIAKKP